MEHLEELNRQLFLSLNASLAPPGHMLGVAKLAANGLIFFVPALLAALWLWGDDRRRSAALKALVVIAAGLGVNRLIGLAWHHVRPQVSGLGQTYLSHAPDASFPSDHTTVFAAAGFALLKGETRWLGLTLLASGLVVGWARVFLGVHFPLDILGAFVVSYLLCYIVSLGWDRVGKNITGYCIRLYRVVLAPVIALGLIRR